MRINERNPCDDEKIYFCLFLTISASFEMNLDQDPVAKTATNCSPFTVPNNSTASPPTRINLVTII